MLRRVFRLVPCNIWYVVFLFYRGTIKENGGEIKLVFQDPRSHGFVSCFWKFDDRVFFATFGCGEDEKSNAQFFWVRLLGRGGNGIEAYSVRAELRKEGLEPSYAYQSHPNSCDVDFERVKKNRRAFIITEDLVERFLVRTTAIGLIGIFILIERIKCY